MLRLQTFLTLQRWLPGGFRAGFRDLRQDGPGGRMKQRENTLVFIDEIQAYGHLLTLVKFLMKEKKFTYIASSSLLGVTLKNTQSVPVGSLDIQHMYPMDFEEFLYANDVGELAVGSRRESFNKQEALSEAMHNKLMDLFKKCLLVGGLPKEGCDRIFQEKFTGTRKDRPELLRMLDMLREGDTVIICELTRLSRSVKDLFDLVERVEKAGQGQEGRRAGTYPL
ncbi:MAG: recombinase family protein [Candidatus Cryptobacteroides sp.]